MTSVAYARYWHGNLSIFRPLLLLFNVSQIRLLMFGVFIILFVYFIYLLAKKFNNTIAGIFALSLICNGYFSAAYSLESSPIFLTMIVGCIVLLKNIERMKNPSIYFFVIACIANFVDFLTVPLITLGFPMLIYIINMQNNDAKLKECILFVIKNSVVWGIGYGLTWMSKWILYDLIFDGEIINMAIDQIVHRTKRTSQLKKESVGIILFWALTLNFMYISCVAMFGNFFEISIKSKNDLKESIPYFLVSMMPIIWYVVLANHTIIHIYFTYRHMAVFLCGCYLGIEKSIKLKRRI